MKSKSRTLQRKLERIERRKVKSGKAWDKILEKRAFIITKYPDLFYG